MAGDKTTADPPETLSVKPPRPKFTRAFSHKVRTGCLTCKIRRKKCDEEKPFCRRCRNEDVKCDGYAPITKTPAAKKTKTSTKPETTLTQTRQGSRLVPRPPADSSLRPLLFTLSNVPPGSGRDRSLFYHFRTWTCGPLSEAPGSSRFWESCVLPLAHHDDLIRKAVTAVGAAHQLFVSRYLKCPQTTLSELERVTTHQYNAAISAVLERLKVGSPVGTHVVLLSCLLFVCLESMVGRYGEVLRHFKAGLRMLKDPVSLGSIHDKSILKHVVEIFGQLACEISIFMEEDLSTDESHRNILLEGLGNDDADEDQRFTSLQHATLALKAMDMEFMSTPCEEMDNCCDPDACKGYAVWNHRFELLVSKLDFSQLSDAERHQVQCLRLQQRQWLIMESLDPEAPPSDKMSEEWSAYLDLAEDVAEPYIKIGKPTFSLDGFLISGLSLMICMTSNFALRHRAVALLRKLNRREGVWDSNEIAEMHQATLSLHDCDSWYSMPIPGGGIPAFVQILSVVSTGISPDNSLLSVPSSAMVAAPPECKPPLSRGESTSSGDSSPISLPLR